MASRGHPAIRAGVQRRLAAAPAVRSTSAQGGASAARVHRGEQGWTVRSGYGGEGAHFCCLFFSVQKSAQSTPPPPPEEPRNAYQSKAKAQSLSASDGLRYPASPAEPQYMRVMHNFISRNSKELTIGRGDILEASVHETQPCVPLCVHTVT